MLSKYKKAFIETSQGVITPPTPTLCFDFVITVLLPLNLSFSYISCAGTPMDVTLNGDNVTHPSMFSGCLQAVTDTPPIDPSKWTVVIGDECS